jgi:hypothetical protein
MKDSRAVGLLEREEIRSDDRRDSIVSKLIGYQQKDMGKTLHESISWFNSYLCFANICQNRPRLKVVWQSSQHSEYLTHWAFQQHV